MHLALYGATGIGKTYTLYHTLVKLGFKVKLIRSLEELRDLPSNVTDIIFDDISFELNRPELLIHLCDKDFDGGVRILRRYQVIKKEVRKWFTHNSDRAWHPVLAEPEQQRAIERRLHIQHVQGPEDITRWVMGSIKR